MNTKQFPVRDLNANEQRQVMEELTTKRGNKRKVRLGFRTVKVGRYKPCTVKSGEKYYVFFDDSMWYFYDAEADSNEPEGYLLVLVSSDFKRIAQGVRVGWQARRLKDIPRCALIDIGEFGWGAHHVPTREDTTSHTSGYGEDWRMYLRNSPGCLVVDKREAYHKSDTFVRSVMACPVFDVRLKPEEIEETKLDGLSGFIAAHMAPVLAAGQLAHKAKGKPGPGPLDAIGTLGYAQWWADREPLVKVGVVNDKGEIVWWSRTTEKE